MGKTIMSSSSSRRTPLWGLALAAVLTVLISGCADIDRGVSTTLDEFAAARAAAELATDLEALSGVEFVSSEYDPVASRLELSLVLSGSTAELREDWTAALDVARAGQAHEALEASSMRATVLAGGGGLVLSPNTLKNPTTDDVVVRWFDLLEVAPIDMRVTGNGDSVSVDITDATMSGDEDSQSVLALEETASIMSSPSITTADQLEDLLSALRIGAIPGVSERWNVPGLTAPLGADTPLPALDTVAAVIEGLDDDAPLAVTYEAFAPRGLGIGVGDQANVKWYGNESFSADDPSASAEWSPLVAIVSGMLLHQGGTVMVMVPGDGALLTVGPCTGTLSPADETDIAVARSLIDAFGDPTLQVAAGFCDRSN